MDAILSSADALVHHFSANEIPLQSSQLKSWRGEPYNTNPHTKLTFEKHTKQRKGVYNRSDIQGINYRHMENTKSAEMDHNRLLLRMFMGKFIIIAEIHLIIQYQQNTQNNTPHNEY